MICAGHKSKLISDMLKVSGFFVRKLWCKFINVTYDLEWVEAWKDPVLVLTKRGMMSFWPRSSWWPHKSFPRVWWWPRGLPWVPGESGGALDQGNHQREAISFVAGLCTLPQLQKVSKVDLWPLLWLHLLRGLASKLAWPQTVCGVFLRDTNRASCHT